MLKDNFKPGQPFAALPAQWLNTIAQILNTLSIQYAPTSSLPSIDKPQIITSDTPWKILIPKTSGTSLPEDTIIPWSVTLKRSSDDTQELGLYQTYAQWNTSENKFKQMDPENDTFICTLSSQLKFTLPSDIIEWASDSESSKILRYNRYTFDSTATNPWTKLTSNNVITFDTTTIGGTTSFTLTDTSLNATITTQDILIPNASQPYSHTEKLIGITTHQANESTPYQEGEDSEGEDN